MIALLDAELLKLRTTRTFAAIIGMAIGTSVLIAVLVSVLTEPTPDTVLVDVFASDTSSFFVLVLAVIGISGEWRHRTITSSLLAAPDRRRFLAAKTVAFATAGLVTSLVIALSVTVVGTAILAGRGLPLPGGVELAGQVGRNAVLAAILGAFGVAIGALVRNQIVAVVSLLVLMFVIEPLVLALAPSVGRYGPLGALSIAAAGLSAEDNGLGDVSLPSPPVAVALLLVWVGVTLGAATILLRRRDLE